MKKRLIIIALAMLLITTCILPGTALAAEVTLANITGELGGIYANVGKTPAKTAKEVKDAYSAWLPEGYSVGLYVSLAEDAQLVDDNAAVITGMSLRLFTDSSNQVDEISVIVKGDITGDGLSNLMDCMFIVGDVVGLRDLDDMGKQAADMVNDGKINLGDVLAMVKLIIEGPPPMAAPPEPPPTEEPPPTIEPPPTTDPEPEVVDMDEAFRNEVLRGMNEVRAWQNDERADGTPEILPLVLDEEMCAKSKAHIYSQLGGEFTHQCFYLESIYYGAFQNGHSLGVGSAMHVWQMATDSSLTKLGVWTVRFGDTQWSCVIAE